MKQYLDLVKNVYETGSDTDDRTGIGTRFTMGNMLKFDLREGFPIVTTKRTWFKGCKYELKWFLLGPDENGDMNRTYLQNHGIHIWDEWSKPGTDPAENNLGRVYSAQWLAWRGPNGPINQLQECIDTIKKSPESRRMLVSAWNPGELNEMALPPCHMFFQFAVDGEYLDIVVYQRSADLFLGVPFDITEYALLLEVVARCTGKTARMLTYMFGNTHIYKNHFEQVEEMLSRTPYDLPKIKFNNTILSIDDYDPEQVELVNYQCHPTIKAPVAV